MEPVKHTTPQAEKPQTDFEATQEHVLSAVVDKILAEVERLKEPLRREALQKALASLTDRSDEAESLRVEKASGPLVPLVRWLLGCSREQKVAAVLAGRLLDCDVAEAIRDAGLYDGQIGHAVSRSWTDELLGDLEQLNERELLAFVAGLDTGVS